MTNEWDQSIDEQRRSRRWLWILAALLLTFAFGAATAVYVLQRSEPARALAGLAFETTLPPATVTVQQPIAPADDRPQPATAALSRRITGVEQQITALAERTTETSSNAARAEGLLVAFAARRALDRGTPLGYIEGLLRERFGGGQPQAVATILSASRQPVTLEELQTGLDAVAPALTAREPDESWWDGIRQELSGLVVLRRASVPSVAPVDRLTRARRQLEMGHVDLALAEVARLPGRANASRWIVQARRYVSVRRALDIIETAALLAPHVAPVIAPVVTQTTPARPAVPDAPVAVLPST